MSSNVIKIDPIECIVPETEIYAIQIQNPFISIEDSAIYCNVNMFTISNNMYTFINTRRVAIKTPNIDADIPSAFGPISNGCIFDYEKFLDLIYNYYGLTPSNTTYNIDDIPEGEYMYKPRAPGIAVVKIKPELKQKQIPTLQTLPTLTPDNILSYNYTYKSVTQTANIMKLTNVCYINNIENTLNYKLKFNYLDPLLNKYDPASYVNINSQKLKLTGEQFASVVSITNLNNIVIQMLTDAANEVN
jgi:hypothetical protein